MECIGIGKTSYLPDKTSPGISQLVTQQNGFDDKCEHLPRCLDDWNIGFCRGFQQQEPEKEEDVEVVESDVGEEVPLEWALRALLQACFQSKMRW